MGLTSSAAKASLVGLKPTPGFVSRAGMVIGDAFQDGPVLITRTVDDAALLMTLLAGKFSPWRPNIRLNRAQEMPRHQKPRPSPEGSLPSFYH